MLYLLMLYYEIDFLYSLKDIPVADLNALRRSESSEYPQFTATAPIGMDGSASNFFAVSIRTARISSPIDLPTNSLNLYSA